MIIRHATLLAARWLPLPLALLIVVAGCATRPPVAGRTVPLQTRQTWAFAGSGVRFDNQFSGARLNGVEQTSPAEFTVRIDPENRPINRSPWYAFRVSAVSNQTVAVKFHLTYPGLAALPKLSTDGTNWTPLASNAWTLQGTNRVARLAVGTNALWVFAHVPIGLETMDRWMADQARRPFARQEIIGRSVEGRPLRQLTFTETTNRNYVFVIGRQHPPEITGTVGLMSFVETITSGSELAQRFRREFQTVVVPLVNPDGVHHGHWRSTLGGLDPNRDWAKFTQRETRATSDAILKLGRAPGARPFLFVDFHSTGEDVFYTQRDDEVTFPKDFTKRWMAAIAARFPAYKFKRDAGHNVNQPTSKHWAYTTFGIPGITCEFGYGTDRELIRTVAAGAAEEMMKLLLAEGKR